MTVSGLIVTCLAAQALVIGVLYLALRRADLRVTLTRITGFLVFAGLEAAIVWHLAMSNDGELFSRREVITDISLAVLLALSYSLFGNLSGRLRHSDRQITRITDLNTTLFDQTSEP